METSAEHLHSDPTEAIEALARTVAHLAVQLTIAQLQLRGLGQILAGTGAASGEDVMRATEALAKVHAGAFVNENLGSALSGLVDVGELEARIISFLTVD